MYRHVILAVLVCAGCKQDDGPPVPTSAPDLQIVSAGDAPRRVLRYRAAKRTAQQLEVAIDMELTAGELGGPMPTLVLHVTTRVEDVLPTGGMRLRTTIDDVTARERLESRVAPNALSGPMSALKGLAITATLSPNGRLVGSKIDDDKQLPETMRTQMTSLVASFDQMMMPLPDDPVGIGAVWRSSRVLEQGGMKTTAVNTIQLTSSDGDELAFTIDTAIHGDDQTVKQGDLAVEIRDVTGTGGGKGTIDLGTLAVTSELTTELRSSMQAPGEAQPMPMTMRFVTRVMPR